MAKKDTFEGVSDEELRRELIQREADRRAAFNAVQQKCRDLVLKNIDLLI